MKAKFFSPEVPTRDGGTIQAVDRQALIEEQLRENPLPQLFQAADELRLGQMTREEVEKLLGPSLESALADNSQMDAVSLEPLICATTAGIHARPKFTVNYAWCLICKEAVDKIIQWSDGKPVLDVMAGLGYWAKCLYDAGVDVHPTDVCVSPIKNGYIEEGRSHYIRVYRADAAKVIKDHPGGCYLLCWPPYGSDSGFRAAREVRVDEVLIYVGEWGGCTGDDQLHGLLSDKFDELDEVDIPCFPGIRDRMYVLRRMRD